MKDEKLIAGYEMLTVLTMIILQTIIPNQYGLYKGDDFALERLLKIKKLPIIQLQIIAPNLTTVRNVLEIVNVQIPTMVRLKKVTPNNRFDK